MEYCYTLEQLSSQYVSGFVTGALVGIVFTSLFKNKAVKFLLSWECPLPEDIITEYEKEVMGDEVMGDEVIRSDDEEPVTNFKEEPLNIKDILGKEINEEDKECPDKNTIILRLTDTALINLFQISSNMTRPIDISEEEVSELDRIFNNAVNGGAGILVDEGDDEYKPSGSASTPGYVKLEDFGEKPFSNKDSLPFAEERKILKQFNNLLFLSLEDARQKAAIENYSLHVLYVGMGPKMPLPSYSSTTIGIRISDPNWNGAPSSDAVVKEIIDVGGVDLRDRGIIKL